MLEQARRYQFKRYVIDFEGLRVEAAQRQHFSERLALAWRYQLAGVAGWRLGQEDPAIRVLLRQFQSN